MPVGVNMLPKAESDVATKNLETEDWNDWSSQYEFFRNRNQFNQHLKALHYAILPITQLAIDHAVTLIYRYPLAAYDAVHLANSLDYRQTNVVTPNRFYFITADEQLQRAAEAEGLQAENPNDHP
jgi:predicted nucleic acid-binding protein